jgi:hypothetical protein
MDPQLFEARRAEIVERLRRKIGELEKLTPASPGCQLARLGDEDWYIRFLQAGLSYALHHANGLGDCDDCKEAVRNRPQHGAPQ